MIAAAGPGGAVWGGQEGVDFGKVSHLFNNGANDVMFVQGERVRLLPFVMDDYIKNIDFDAQTILVDWEADF